MLKAKRDAAINQARIGLSTARDDPGTASTPSVAAEVQSTRSSRSPQRLTAGGTSAGVFTFVIKSSAGPSSDPTAAEDPAARCAATVQGVNLAVQYAPVPAPAGRPGLVKGLIVGEPVPARSGLFELYYLFPLTAEEQTIALDPAHRAARRPRAGRPRPGHRAARHPAGGAAGAGRGRDGRPARRRRPVAADRGPRQRRHRPARTLVQRHGRQPATPDPPARGPLPAAAPVHQRRLARAAHPADHDPDGRSSTCTRSRDEFPPELSRAAELLHDRARPVRVAARRPAGDLALRRRASRTSSPSRPTSAASSPPPSRPPGMLAERHGSEVVVEAARRTPVTRRHGLAAGRAHPAQPGRQRARPRRGQAGRDHHRLRRRRGRGDRARPRRRAAARAGRAGVQPLLARRPVAQPADRRHRPRPGDLARGRPAARRLAAGVGRARARRAVPADPAAPGRAHADALAAAARSGRDRDEEDE